MRIFILILFLPVFAFCQQQERNIIGVFSTDGFMTSTSIKFNADSTFEYKTSGQHPVFFRWEQFYEKGRWALSGDTILLNPQLPKRIFVQSDLFEEQTGSDTTLILTFNHVKRLFDSAGKFISADTIQIDRLDFAFNEWKKKNITRVAPDRTARCTFAGYIPKEVITGERTISGKRPPETLRSIFIGCYELQGTKEFLIKDPKSNHFTFNVYSNYYQDGMIRQRQFLIKNNNVIYTHQNKDGRFNKDNIWSGGAYDRLSRVKTNTSK